MILLVTATLLCPAQLGFSTRTPLLTEQGAPSLPFQPTLFGRGVAAVDVDRDGDNDFVIATSSGAVAYVNHGASGFSDESAVRLPPGLSSATLPIAGDLDGNGWVDLVLLSESPTDADVVLFSDGGGGFLPPVPLPMAAAVASDAELVDIDKDGDLDLIRAIGSSGHTNSAGRDGLLINDGTGDLSPLVSFESAPWNDSTVPTTGVLALDANGDRHVDLYFTKADSGSLTGTPGARNRLLLGIGNRRFIDASIGLPPLLDNSFDAVAVDIEGDGDVDIIVANSLLAISGADSGDVLINQGGAQGGRPGMFLDRPAAIEETPMVSEAIRLGPLAADVDGDGRTDVMFRVHDLPPGGEQPLFRGTGQRFLRAASIDTGSFVAAGGAFTDVDGDGDQDLLLTSSGSAGGGSPLGVARLFINVSR